MQACREESHIVECLRIALGDGESVAATHRQSAHGAVLLSLGSLVVSLDILYNIHKALVHSGCGLGGVVDAGHERRLIHATAPLTWGSLTVDIAIGHDHYHGLCLACGYQIVHDLGGTAQRCPCILVATGTMQEIHHRIVLATLITSWGVDGKAALHFQRGTVVPHLADIAVRHFVDTIEVALVAVSMADNEDAGERCHVAADIDIGGVENAHAVDHERVVVELGSQSVGGVGPHTVLPLFQLGLSGGLLFAERRVNHGGRQEIAGHDHARSLGRMNAEGDGVVGVYNGRLHLCAAPKRLLCADGYHACQAEDNG